MPPGLRSETMLPMGRMNPRAIASMETLKPLTGDHYGPLRATAVIVLYGMAPKESHAFLSLIEARAKLTPPLGRVSIVLWDNSPFPNKEALLADSVAYIHDLRNLGLAAAYNKSLEIALQNGSNWLITLDQDTTVPPNYLVEMANAERKCLSCAVIGAIVPQIAVGAKRLSPNYFLFGAVPRWFGPGFRGVPRPPISAFNSGAMVRTDVLKQIGGYDTRFPLDYSDAAMFRLLHAQDRKSVV